MVNSPQLFDNLFLSKKGTVDRRNEGLDIQGKGTFKLIIRYDGRLHNIHIPNSLYLPELKKRPPSYHHNIGCRRWQTTRH
jgi:hypothetical protein